MEHLFLAFFARKTIHPVRCKFSDFVKKKNLCVAKPW